jgi:hypothetical protein
MEDTKIKIEMIDPSTGHTPFMLAAMNGREEIMLVTPL